MLGDDFQQGSPAQECGVQGVDDRRELGFGVTGDQQAVPAVEDLGAADGRGAVLAVHDADELHAGDVIGDGGMQVGASGSGL
ncbi:hypothetical protein ACFYY1_39160 [Streptomyces sp. NPDC001890]|uniref:hypothetical protein n=1 Tax=Streptomyces sp. NPDC001890 TaxID=3364620 RepID=UPI00368DD56F